jgi:hypothetical protein
MTSTYWKEAIFNKASTPVSQLKFDALFLLLTALGILKVQKTNDKIQWTVSWQPPVLPQSNVNVTFVNATIGKATYKLDEYWNGIHQHPPTRIRVRAPPIPVAPHYII